jgi:hypothetical protein
MTGPSLIIDTGSSDTFVLAQIDNQCRNPEITYTYDHALAELVGHILYPSSAGF